MSRTRELIGSAETLAAKVNARKVRTPARIKMAIDDIGKVTGQKPRVTVGMAKEYLRDLRGTKRQFELLDEALVLCEAKTS